MSKQSESVNSKQAEKDIQQRTKLNIDYVESQSEKYEVSRSDVAIKLCMDSLNHLEIKALLGNLSAYTKAKYS